MVMEGKMVPEPKVERLLRHLALEQVDQGHEVGHRAQARLAARELLGHEVSDELVGKVLSHGFDVAISIHLLNQVTLGKAVATVNPKGDLDISTKG